MAKVVLFPENTKLPNEVEGRIYEIAKEYIEVLNSTKILLGIEDVNDPTFEEVCDLVGQVFAKGLACAIEKSEEDS